MILRLLLVMLLVAGCAPAEPVTIDGAEPAAALRAFDGCDALTERMRDRALEQVGPYGLEPAGAVALQGRAAAEAAEGGMAADVTAAAGQDAAFSGTNVQEAGVDEGDVVKSDGAWLYSVVDGTLRVVDVRADRPAVAATVSLDDGLPRDLLLVGDRLLVLGDVTPSPGEGEAPAGEATILPLPWSSQTRLWLLDVSDPTRPRTLSTMKVDGGTVSTRLTGEIARIVLRSDPMLPGLVAPTTDRPGDVRRALEINRERVRAGTADAWLPRAEVDGAAPAPLVGCAAVHAPPEPSDLGMVTVLSLDLGAATLSPERARSVLGAADTVYANEDRLYVTTSRWPVAVPLPVDPMPLPRPVEPPVDLPAPGDPDAPVSDGGVAAPPVEPAPVEPVPPVEPTVDPVEPVPPTVDPVEPVPPTVPPVEPTGAPRDLPRPQDITTEVHRFDLDGTTVRYVASGSVPGTLLNQWALSEHRGDLRVATTETDMADPGLTHSAVRILRERDGRLREVGHVGDLGRGERIFAVRYAGDVGFVVTFRQVDPLYTLDLSDPRDPQVLGELKIPGYSAYLHPVDADHLLGIGQDADADGRTRGVQASLFDVSDLRDPRRTDQLRLGRDTTTSVEFDHRAFLHWPREGVAVLPVESWSTGAVGAAVLEVEPTGGLAERGFVSHAARDGMAPPVQRALVVGDRLVTVSPVSVLASDLRTLAPLGEAAFAP